MRRRGVDSRARGRRAGAVCERAREAIVRRARCACGGGRLPHWSHHRCSRACVCRALYIFSSSASTQTRIIETTSSGGVGVNETAFHILNPHLPFGGVGASGMGAYHGRFGFEALSHKKAVLRKATWYVCCICCLTCLRKMRERVCVSVCNCTRIHDAVLPWLLRAGWTRTFGIPPTASATFEFCRRCSRASRRCRCPRARWSSFCCCSRYIFA